MGRMVFLLKEDLGIKVSVRAGPDETRVQFICLKECNELSAEEAVEIADSLRRAAKTAESQADVDL